VGAVYTPAWVMVPHTGGAQPVPAMLQKIARAGFEFAAGVIVAAYVAEVPASTDAGPSMETENVLLRFTETVAVLEESAALTAIRLADGGVGSICGAVYVPLESTLPQAAPAQPLPESTHVTDRFGVPAEFTEAVKGWLAPNSTEIICGEIETEMSLDIVACAEKLLVESSTLVAVTETKTVAGKLAGAV
jgi:hypothetical protein